MGEFLKGSGACLMQIIWFVGGSLQFFAVISMAHVSWGWGWIISFFIAAFLAYIPIVGTIVGICGAIYVWEWPWWGALLLFGWQYLLFGGLAAVLTLLEKRS